MRKILNDHLKNIESYSAFRQVNGGGIAEQSKAVGWGMILKASVYLSIGILLNLQSVEASKDASDRELQERARKELGPSKDRSKRKEKSNSAVNGVEIRELPDGRRKERSWRIGLEVQSYSFSGDIETSLNENFSLAESGSAPMFGLETCRKLYPFSPSLHLDSCLSLSYARQTVNLDLSSGAPLSDVKLQAFLPHAQVGLNWKPLRRLPAYIAGSLGAGSYIFTHRSAQGLANDSYMAGLYTLGLSTRFEIGSVSFLQASYIFRGLFMADEKQSIQPHNFVASAGIIF